MLTKFLIAIVIIASTGVLPAPSRPRTKRLSRGPVWTKFQGLAVDSDAVAEANKIASQRRRLAVVAVTKSLQPDAADIAADVIRQGLRYSDQLIVLDASTSESLFGSNSDPSKARTICQGKDIDMAVLVRVDAQGKKLHLEVVSSQDDSIQKLDPVAIANLADAVIDAPVEARTTLLKKWHALPTKNLQQLGRRPQATFAAIAQVIKARRMLVSVAQEKVEAKRKRICRKAITEVNAAIDVSPKYLEAYLIKASCQDELEQTVELKRTLTEAFEKCNLPQQDRLTAFELKGDYARFVKSDALESLAAYEKLLKADPTNLTGLWAIIDISLSPPGGADADEAGAGMYAARLVEFHPQSGVAQAIMAKE